MARRHKRKPRDQGEMIAAWDSEGGPYGPGPAAAVAEAVLAVRRGGESTFPLSTASIADALLETLPKGYYPVRRHVETLRRTAVRLHMRVEELEALPQKRRKAAKP